VHWAGLQGAAQVGEQTYKAAEFAQNRADLAHRATLAAYKAPAKVQQAKLPDVLALVNVNPPAAPTA
jgi:hypothetical protein